MALLLLSKVCVIAAILGRALAHLELLDELRHRARLLLLLIEPGVVNLQEDPLRPLKVGRIRGLDGTAQIVAQAKQTQLATHILNIRLRGGARVRTSLDSVLLRRQTEGVITQRVQDILAQHAVKTGISIRSDITQRVTHVQTRTRRVGEHVLDVELLSGEVSSLRERADRVRCVESSVILPVLLPGLFDLRGELRRVTVGGGIARVSHALTV